MPSFHTQVPHHLGQQGAQERLQGFLDKVRDEYKSQVSQFEESWSDNVLNFSFASYGFKIQGTLTVEEEAATIQGSLPLAAVAFRGKIEKTIQQALESALA